MEKTRWRGLNSPKSSRLANSGPDAAGGTSVGSRPEGRKDSDHLDLVRWDGEILTMNQSASSYVFAWPLILGCCASSRQTFGVAA